ncbi:hypothetical protein TPA0598_10_04080 [Streptomyces lydicamycinicus]|uniref:Uncharacterized protein n=1 Tax=Streptomyces lydicamycinicus TaxID=1546107 RepID=A0A0P4RGD1_9ACTN|nr:hypothetical protein TPA0598_10_04080 [Streptomyces lydicamycinicus]
MHGGPVAGEQHGERFCGKGDPQVEHSGQDLITEGEPRRAATPGIAVGGQSLGEDVQLPLGHPGQGWVGQQGLVPLRLRRLRGPGCRDCGAGLGVQGIVPVAVERVPGQRQCRHLRVTDTDAGGIGVGVE